MNTKEFKTLVETLDLEDGLKEKVLELTKPKGDLVPEEWAEDTHYLREVENEEGNKYILLDVSVLTGNFYAAPVEEGEEPSLEGGGYLPDEEPFYFTGRKFVLARTDVPENIEDIEPGERFVGEYFGRKAILVRTDDEELPWSVHLSSSHDYAYDREVKLHRRLVEV
ncbi:hypothetical protein [Corynebacterium guaraldiae]|uniref:hypothetical protein n=1 Tax=Corynebacterium guaraldiae TaxID=3051103 RepID=UPI001177692A|nr:hypothetical protein [Corynebacterium guaraldiae]TRX43710.1 hypothetical protein FNY89_00995 [Corynebacterium guaraldiae]